MTYKSISPMQRLQKIRKTIYIIVIVAGLINIFFPTIAFAAGSSDIFKNDVQDVYAEITTNVDETNDILDRAFAFCQTSPYQILNNSTTPAADYIHTASQQVALVIATLLLVDFFKKTTSFEWSSKWENVLVFLVKVIVVKQVVQNADVIINYIYAIFNHINGAARVSATTGLLPHGNVVTYHIEYKKSLLKDMWTEGLAEGWTNFWEAVGADETTEILHYRISWDAVNMFFPDAVPVSRENWTFEEHLIKYPTDTMFQPTMKIVFMQPYFLVMKAISYIIFVIAIGRVFELCIYTMFAPLPLATFASDTSHEVGKGFIKSYVAVVLQVAVMIAMFAIFLAINNFVSSSATFKTMPLIQFVVLISLGLGITKSGAWAKKICGAS